MNTKVLFIILAIFVTFSSCSKVDDLYLEDSISTMGTRSSEFKTYTLEDIIDTIDVSNTEIIKLNQILFLMQNEFGSGYRPLLQMLSKTPINKIYTGLITTNSAAGYNPFANYVVIGNTASLKENMLEEELIHAGQNRVYPNGIGQYYKKPGNSNIEFEAKLTQDLISYLNGGYINIGATQDNFDKYTFWVMDICENNDSGEPAFPSMEMVLHFKLGDYGYFRFAEDLGRAIEAYNYPVLMNLDPLYINFTYLNYGK